MVTGGWIMTDYNDLVPGLVEALAESDALIDESNERNLAPMLVHPDIASLYDRNKHTLAEARRVMEGAK